MIICRHIKHERVEWMNLSALNITRTDWTQTMRNEIRKDGWASEKRGAKAAKRDLDHARTAVVAQSAGKKSSTLLEAFFWHSKLLVPLCKLKQVHLSLNLQEKRLSTWPVLPEDPLGFKLQFSYTSGVVSEILSICCLDWFLEAFLFMAVGKKHIFCFELDVLQRFIQKRQIGSGWWIIKGFMPCRAVVGCERSLCSSDAL